MPITREKRKKNLINYYRNAKVKFISQTKIKIILTLLTWEKNLVKFYIIYIN